MTVKNVVKVEHFEGPFKTEVTASVQFAPTDTKFQHPLEVDITGISFIGGMSATYHTDVHLTGVALHVFEGLFHLV